MSLVKIKKSAVEMDLYLDDLSAGDIFRFINPDNETVYMVTECGGCGGSGITGISGDAVGVSYTGKFLEDSLDSPVELLEILKPARLEAASLSC